MNDHRSLSPMDIVAVLTTVTKEQQAKLVAKDGEIADLRAAIQKQDGRLLHMEKALAELQRH
jgi:hypothetical protein